MEPLKLLTFFYKQATPMEFHTHFTASILTPAEYPVY